MMRWIVARSLQFRLLVLAIAAAILFVGINHLRTMSVDILPEFAPPFIEVQTEAPGLSDSEVEKLVTFNLEGLLSGVPWLHSIRSTSIPGLSSITLIFEPGTDILRARQLVSERLNLAYTLPNVALAPVILQPLSATSRVMMVGLSSRKISLMEMSVLAHWNIRPALLSVPGVANIAIWGMRDKQLHVLADPAQLQAKNVTLDQIISTTGNTFWVSPLSFLNASTPGSGGWIETPQQRIEIRHAMPISSPSTLAKVVIEGSNLQLGDVTKIVEGHQPLIGDGIVNGESGLLIVIDKFPAANTLEVTRQVEAKLAQLQPGLAGIQIDTSIFRPASFVQMSIDNVSTTLLIGLILLTLVLLILFYDWWAVVTSVIAIVASLVVALLILNLRGATMNMMVIAGLIISIAIVVDEVIIDIENMKRRLATYKDSKTNADNVLQASVETRGVMLYAFFILLLSLLPVFFLGGISGVFYQPLGWTYAFAIVGALLVALTLTPAIYLLLSGLPLKPRQSYVMHWVSRSYNKCLQGVMGLLSPALFVIAAIICSALTLCAMLFLVSQGGSLIPSLKEPNIMVEWDGPAGTSIQEMQRISALAMREIQAIPGVLNVAADIGRAVLGDQLVNVNSAELVVSIDPRANYETTVKAIRHAVRSYPGMFYVVQTYLSEKIRQVLTGSNSDIVIRLYGPNLMVLHNIALNVKNKLSSIDDIPVMHIDEPAKQPQIIIKVDLDKAKQYGLKPGDVRRAVSTYLSGIEAGSLFEEQKVFQIEVWGAPDTRHSLNSVRDLLINTPKGKSIRLADIATVKIFPALNFIQHEAVSRKIDVSLNLRGSDANATTDLIRQRIQEIKFPLEYHAEILNVYQEQHQAHNYLLGIWLSVVIGILLLLQAAFSSWRLAFVFLISLPFALLGGVLAAVLINSTTLTALLGLLAIFGITVRNSLMLIKHYQHLIWCEQQPFGIELILRGTAERFVSVFIAVIATLFTLLPFALCSSLPGLEVASSIAIIIMGGLITSLIFSLFIVPCLYLWLGSDIHRNVIQTELDDLS